MPLRYGREEMLSIYDIMTERDAINLNEEKEPPEEFGKQFLNIWVNRFVCHNNNSNM